MIPQAYITAWRKKAPWQEDFQVEQDLVIERALMAIYSNEYLKERLPASTSSTFILFSYGPPQRGRR